MSTERFDASDNIISSQASAANTMRVDSTIISSDAPASAASTAQHFTLNNKAYNVIRQIASSGEAEVFLVEEGGRQQVLKYYFSNYKPKDAVIKKLQQIKRADIIAPLDYGYYQDRFWEINDYMTGGTLGDVLPIKDLNRFKDIVGRVTEAIHACHVHQIIHRDIKPVNIFFRNGDKQELVLGDFGIASPLQDGENYRVTTVARTTTYAAPELFTNIDNYTTLDNSVDYYALGISLLEVWIGDDPFKGISQFNIMRIKNEGRVFMPPDIHADVETLIKGLITTEPPKRWGYEEVKKWLRGEPVKVYYQTQEIKFTPYEFDKMQGIYANDPKELAYYMERNPQKAAKQLYSRSISDWVKSASQDLFSEIFDIVEKAWPNTSDENVEAGITKTIYLLDKDRPFKSYDGSEWLSPADLGMHVEQHAAYYKKDLQHPSAKLYLFLEARGLQDRADKYRKYYKNQPADKAFNLVVLDLQENVLKYEGHRFENLNQLSAAPDAVQQKLLQEITDPHSKASVWLDSSFNHLTDSINTWRSLKDYNTVSLRYALKTGGFRLAGREVFNEAEFYQLLTAMPDAFTVEADAARNRREADYWLTNYQQSSLLNVLIQHKFLQDKARTFPQFRSLYEYLLTEKTNDNPFESTAKLAQDIRQITGDDPDQLQAIVDIARPSFVRYMQAQRQLKVYATESLYEVIRAIGTIHKAYPLLGEKILFSLNPEIDSFVHDDFTNLRNNSAYFDLLMKHLGDFLENTLVSISTELPYYKHWQKEQQLISKRSGVIEGQMNSELENEKAVIYKKFDQFVTTYIENQVNYLEKGKRFYVIFTRCVGWALALSFFLTAYFAQPTYNAYGVRSGSGMTWPIVIGVVILLITGFMVRYVKNRRPNGGLGAIFDPIHKIVGKFLYRPILSKLKADQNSSINKQAMQPRETELQKAADINKGKRTNLLFEERVRIVLLPNQQLETEWAKL